jgi:hypothetical protein
MACGFDGSCMGYTGLDVDDKRWYRTVDLRVPTSKTFLSQGQRTRPVSPLRRSPVLNHLASKVLLAICYRRLRASKGILIEIADSRALRRKHVVD